LKIDWGRIEDQLSSAKNADDIEQKNKALIQANRAILEGIVYSDDVVSKYTTQGLYNFMVGFGYFTEVAEKYYNNIKPNEKLKEKQAELQQKVATVTQYIDNIKELNQTNEALLKAEPVLTARKKEYDELEKKVARLSELNKISDEDVKDLEARQQEEKALEKSLIEKKRELNTLEESIENIKKELLDAEKIHGTKKTIKTETKEKIVNLKAEIDRLQQETTSLQTEKETLEEQKKEEEIANRKLTLLKESLDHNNFLATNTEKEIQKLLKGRLA